MYKFFIVFVVALSLVACSSPDAPQDASSAQTALTPSMAASTSDAAASSDTRAAVRLLVERFGRQMQKVSTMAPPKLMHRQLQKVYAGLLSPELLRAWQTHPQRVVGRKVSSPWPQRIEVEQIECARADVCRVSGSVDYVTSNELEHGGVFMRRAITLEVTHGRSGWRITAVHLAPASSREIDARR